MNLKSEGKDKKSKNVLIIVVALVVIALIISIIMTRNDNSSDPDQTTTSVDNTDQTGAGTVAVGDDVESITANIELLTNETMALVAEQTQALTDGCGDDLKAFNNKVIGFEARIGEMQTTLAAVTKATESLSADDLASIESAWMKLTEQQATLETNRELVANLSNTCNAQ